MELTKEEKNKEAISTFLEYNGIDASHAVGSTKFETRYFIGEERKLAEETRISFNITGTSDVNVSFFEINDIEYETAFNIKEHTFTYDDDFDTLTITGAKSPKHNEAYKVVINSIYLDFQ